MRTKNAKDLKKRKIRSDKKHRRTKTGNLIKYSSKRDRNAPLKVWWWERRPMTYDGYRNWTKSLRPYVRKITTRFVGKPILVEPERLCNVQAIEDLAVDTIQYPGIFVLMMPTHAKNSFHVCYKKKAKVKIVETEEGLKAKVIWVGSIRRYWFWKGR